MVVAAARPFSHTAQPTLPKHGADDLGRMAPLGTVALTDGATRVVLESSAVVRGLCGRVQATRDRASATVRKGGGARTPNAPPRSSCSRARRNFEVRPRHGHTATLSLHWASSMATRTQMAWHGSDTVRPDRSEAGLRRCGVTRCVPSPGAALLVRALAREGRVTVRSILVYIGGVFRAYTLHGSRHTELYKKIMPLAGAQLPVPRASPPSRIAHRHRASADPRSARPSLSSCASPSYSCTVSNYR